MSSILDYGNYANMVPKTLASENYKVVPHKPTKANNFLEKEIYTRMKVGVPMVKLEFFVRHFLYIQHHRSLTWTLDYTKESDFDDSCGYWYIVPHPGVCLVIVGDAVAPKGPRPCACSLELRSPALSAWPCAPS